MPWSAVRLLRLLRGGELGGLLDGWDGWTIFRDRLVSPDGRAYRERDMRQMWLTLTQAALFRESYDIATGARPLGVGGGNPRRSDWKERHLPAAVACPKRRPHPGRHGGGRPVLVPSPPNRSVSNGMQGRRPARSRRRRSACRPGVYH